MYKEVKIGSQNIPLRASGATPVFYKMLFHRDILQIMKKAKEDTSQLGDCTSELAFVMAKQAEKADMTKLSYEAYIEWLDTFESMDLIMSSLDIMEVYMAGQETTSQIKKKAAKQSGK